MSIEWGNLNYDSDMEMQVRDNTQGETNILDAGLPFSVRLSWDVPPTLAPSLGGSFRLRVFAESLGPGPETQIGPTTVVAVVPGSEHYAAVITIAAGSLPGEGAPDPVTGNPVSGVYKLVSVLQHLNPGPTANSGFAECSGLLQLRTP